MHINNPQGRNVVPFRRNKLGAMGMDYASMYSAYANSQNKGGGSSSAAPPAPPAPTSATAVSPTIQQQFTPQISPVFQQSSGGGTQSASTQQIAPGGQSGQGGAASAQPQGAAPAPSYAASPYGASTPAMADPFGSNFDAIKYGTGSQLIAQQKDNTLLYVIGFVAVLGFAAVMFTGSRNKDKKAST